MTAMTKQAMSRNNFRLCVGIMMKQDKIFNKRFIYEIT